MSRYIEQAPSRHYLPCPVCDGWKSLEDDRCSYCGATAVAVLWDARTASPELAMLVLDNTGRRRP